MKFVTKPVTFSLHLIASCQCAYETFRGAFRIRTLRYGHISPHSNTYSISFGTKNSKHHRQKFQMFIGQPGANAFSFFGFKLKFDISSDINHSDWEHHSRQFGARYLKMNLVMAAIGSYDVLRYTAKFDGIVVTVRA